MVALLFPGQGSQAVGMGGSLFDQFALLTRQADQILGYSIAELCMEDPLGQLGMTQFTQPALFVVSALSYLRYHTTAINLPAYIVGHSAGEYAALFAAGAFDFATGLRLVQKRGDLMARGQDGGMAAVIGLTETQVCQVLETNALSTLALANYNAPTQVVLAGARNELLRAQTFFEAAGAKVYRVLNVSGAFHSPYMAPVQEEFRHYMQRFHFAEPSIPVISTVDAQPFTCSNMPEKLVAQLTQPVRWVTSIQYLLRKGEETFVEIGPGQVLTKLVRLIRLQAAQNRLPRSFISSLA